MFDDLWVLLFWTGQILFALSYVLKDVRWLRRFTVIGCVVATPYYLLREEPLWSPIIWLGIYLVINSVHLAAMRRSGAAPGADEAIRPSAIDVA